MLGLYAVVIFCDKYRYYSPPMSCKKQYAIRSANRASHNTFAVNRQITRRESTVYSAGREGAFCKWNTPHDRHVYVSGQQTTQRVNDTGSYAYGHTPRRRDCAQGESHLPQANTVCTNASYEWSEDCLYDESGQYDMITCLSKSRSIYLTRTDTASFEKDNGPLEFDDAMAIQATTMEGVIYNGLVLTIRYLLKLNNGVGGYLYIGEEGMTVIRYRPIERTTPVTLLPPDVVEELLEDPGFKIGEPISYSGFMFKLAIGMSGPEEIVAERGRFVLVAVRQYRAREYIKYPDPRIKDIADNAPYGRGSSIQVGGYLYHWLTETIM